MCKNLTQEQKEDIERVAETLYHVYANAVDLVSYNGYVLPEWSSYSTDENKIKQANAWRELAYNLLFTAAIKCAYCGFVSMKDTREENDQAIKDHVKECVNHPMKTFYDENLALKAEIEQLKSEMGNNI